VIRERAAANLSSPSKMERRNHTVSFLEKSRIPVRFRSNDDTFLNCPLDAVRVPALPGCGRIVDNPTERSVGYVQSGN